MIEYVVIFMKCVGTCIFCLFGGVLIANGLPNDNRNRKDYSKYPRTLGTHVCDFGSHNERHRMVVEFVDADGIKRLGFHDYDYRGNVPERHVTKEVYYWRRTDSCRYSINGKPIDYEVHYCDEHIYDEFNEEMRKGSRVMVVFGSLLAAFGVYILLTIFIQ